MAKIGERIRNRRIQLNISQTDLAYMISSTKQNVYKYENGIITNIPSDKIEAIALALQTTPSYIMGWEDKDSKAQEVSPEAQKIAKAFDKAKPKEKNMVRLTLSEYLDEEEPQFQYAAARGGGLIKIPLQNGDEDELPEEDTIIEGL